MHARRYEDDNISGRDSTIMFSARILMFCLMLGLAGPVFAQQDADGDTPGTTAGEVVDAATLKLFVKEAVKVIKSGFADSRHQDHRA